MLDLKSRAKLLANRPMCILSLQCGDPHASRQPHPSIRSDALLAIDGVSERV